MNSRTFSHARKKPPPLVVCNAIAVKGVQVSVVVPCYVTCEVSQLNLNDFFFIFALSFPINYSLKANANRQEWSLNYLFLTDFDISEE